MLMGLLGANSGPAGVKPSALLLPSECTETHGDSAHCSARLITEPSARDHVWFGAHSGLGIVIAGISAKCQQRKWRRLFDHLVRPREQCRRNGQPAGLCGSQVHDQLKPCWTLNRYIGGSGTFEYFVYVKSHSPHDLHGIWSI